MTIKTQYALKKELKKLQKIADDRELKIAWLRADILERTTEFVDQTEVVFGLVDYIFDPQKNEGIATLGEARRRWEEFKRVVDQSSDHKEILDTLGIEVTVHHSENQKMIMDQWNKSKQ
jgi:hypothetical protein